MLEVDNSKMSAWSVATYTFVQLKISTRAPFNACFKNSEAATDYKLVLTGKQAKQQ